MRLFCFLKYGKTKLASIFAVEISTKANYLSIFAKMTPQRYYLTEVDKVEDSIYCFHDAMGENDIQLHQHKKAQLLYTEGGVVHISVPDKTYFLPARHYMWIPPEVPHSIHASSPEIMMRNLYFPIKNQGIDFFQQIGIYAVNDLLLQLLLFSNRWHGDILTSSQEDYIIAEAIRAILPQISTMNLPLALPFSNNQRLEKILAFMASNLHNPIAFPELCDKFGFSQRSLARLFHAELGMTFIQYYTILRILKSLQLLLEEKLPVSEVAISVGYSSIPTFSNTFCNLIGCRPSEYLKIQTTILK